MGLIKLSDTYTWNSSDNGWNLINSGYTCIIIVFSHITDRNEEISRH